MKWGPQPKPRCGRPDCDRDARQYGYCPNHAALLDRNGTPYTQEEVVGMREANRHAQEMDAALAADEPVIEWVLDKRRRVMVAASIHDPHAEKTTRTPDIQVDYIECTDADLLAAARTEL